MATPVVADDVDDAVAVVPPFIVAAVDDTADAVDDADDCCMTFFICAASNNVEFCNCNRVLINHSGLVNATIHAPDRHDAVKCSIGPSFTSSIFCLVV